MGFRFLGADVLLGTSCVEYRQKLLDRLGVGRS